MHGKIEPKRELPEQLIILLSLLVVIVTPFASDSYTPSLPAMTFALGSTSDQMQLTMTTYLIAVATSQLVYGPLSDRYGRRPIILIGFIIIIIGSLLCAVANSLFLVLLARFIQGCGAGVSNALFRALMRDKFTGYKMSQVSSYAGMMYTIAFAGAPVLGGYIQYLFGWRANFIFVAVLVFIIFLILWSLLPETHLKRDVTATRIKNILRNYIYLLSSPNFVGYTLISSLAYSGFIAYYTAAPFLLENEVGLTPVQFGWLSFWIACGLFIGMFINVKLVVSKGVSFLLLIGVIIMNVSSLFMLIIGLLQILNTFVIISPIIFFALAASFVFANSMTNAFMKVGHIAGVAGGMYGFLQILTAALTSILVVKVHEKTQIPLACILTGLSLTALILFYLLSRLPANIASSKK